MEYVFQSAGRTELHDRLRLPTLREFLELLRPKWLPPINWEVGFVPNEGETMIGAQVLGNITTDRGTHTDLELFTNVSPGETITCATLTHPTGGAPAYAPIQIEDTDWSEGAAGVYTANQETFTAGAGGWTGSIQGYAICSKGTTPRILAIEVDANGPYTLNENDTYKITPQITFKDSLD